MKFHNCHHINAGLNYEAHENRDGDITNGGYTVLLPDGRTQHVTYNVGEGYAGYIADVKYSGEAKPYHHKPAPKYKPAPPTPYKPKTTSKPVSKPVTTPAPTYKPAPEPSNKPTASPVYYKPLPSNLL